MEPREQYSNEHDAGQARARAQAQAYGQGAAESARRAASDAAREASQVGKQQAERAKDTMTSNAREAADAVDRAARELRSSGQSTIAEGASQLAGQLSRAASWLEQHSIDDLLRQTEQIARRNPALFVAGSIAVGFALSRFLKASESSASERATESEYSTASGSYRPAHSESDPARYGPSLGSDPLGYGPSVDESASAGQREDVPPFTATLRPDVQKGSDI